MTKPIDLREVPNPPSEVIDAASDGDLVLFVGAGVSRLLNLPSWEGFAENALEDLRQASLLNYADIDQIKKLDPRKQLSIAKLIAEDNEYNLDLAKQFEGVGEGDSIYKSLNDIGCTCVTTNYDELLSPRFKTTPDHSAVPATGTRISDRNKFYSNLLDKPGNVIHLHGAASNPRSMIVTMQDYLAHYDDENVHEFLRVLFQRKTVVFIGYGLNEAELLEHILRRGGAKIRQDRRRFAIQGFFKNEEPLYHMLHRYYEKSFGVELLGFLMDHRGFECQQDIAEDWARRLEVKAPTLMKDAQLLNEVFPDE
jgi:hypothetical protein